MSMWYHVIPCQKNRQLPLVFSYPTTTGPLFDFFSLSCLMCSQDSIGGDVLLIPQRDRKIRMAGQRSSASRFDIIGTSGTSGSWRKASRPPDPKLWPQELLTSWAKDFDSAKLDGIAMLPEFKTLSKLAHSISSQEYKSDFRDFKIFIHCPSKSKHRILESVSDSPQNHHTKGEMNWSHQQKFTGVTPQAQIYWSHQQKWTGPAVEVNSTTVPKSPARPIIESSQSSQTCSDVSPLWE